MIANHNRLKIGKPLQTNVCQRFEKLVTLAGF